ncbi:glutathione S-transferase family protein [Acinetobacter cumulans]|uniref:Glutathione S-transferase family protein n=1 Tax=Acinetobacter cumulans TaxID=2136182 RepID=A0A498D5S8_9GAMM|nr:MULTISPECIES: glutathione S-transferase family protein [Acinetobacter]RFS29238.1 glutathione S-transferase family protein [Acinetobacter sp. SWAC5]RKG40177.1 glutathione S-transferase family protein [Acinetobacter cumulans]RLL33165.1 glutathione S-transferase family protein [Acinetobacter cumulans]RZG56661.1 glutathione S-transferase family protein [Acinetobacter sp. WCHAc060006]
MRTLYQFPLSHFCEKARWLLDHKELEYTAHNLMPGVHRAFAQLKTGQNKLPILRDEECWVADSTQIALYLDEKYPEHGLLRADPQLRTQALDINLMSIELGQHVRRWGLSHVLNEGGESLDILIGEKGYLRQFEKYSKPILKAIMSKGYQLDSDKVAQSKTQMQQLIEQLNEKIIEQGGRYFVGDRIGLADIAVCSMLAPILELAGTPWEKESEDLLSDEFKDYKAYLQELPLGQYVQRIYQTERNARVDWRGV